MRFVNDSKATNIEAALRAIQSFDPGLVVILGGQFKGGDFCDLREALVARRAAVVAIGEAAPRVREALAAGMYRCTTRPTWSAAVRTAFALASRRATPCSSRRRARASTCFVNYAERGRAFKSEVARLSEEWARTTTH